MNTKFNATLIAFTMMAYSGLTMSNARAQINAKKTINSSVLDKPITANIEQGKTLMSKSDCLTCHKLNIKLIGPAYKDIAAKYPATPANYAKLTQKVINGSSGSWGQVAMPAHPNLAPADVKKMIEYIFTIK